MSKLVTTKQQRLPVSVSTRDYVNSHGKEPRGQGHWGFVVDGEWVWFSGAFADAKRSAIDVARQRGATFVEVLS